MLRLASPDPRTSSSHTKRRSRLSTVSEEDLDSPMYESLEEVHVLVLAHVLRRPIIVVSDTVLKVIPSILETLKTEIEPFVCRMLTVRPWRQYHSEESIFPWRWARPTVTKVP